MNYIFDLFGTLITNNIERYYSILLNNFKITKEEYKKNLRTFLSTSDFETKELALNSILKHLKKEMSLKEKEKFFKELQEWKDSLEPYPSIISTIKKLKEKGSNIAIVSNNNKLIEDVLNQKWLKEITNIVILSHKIGEVKPDTEIYEKAKKTLNCEYSDIIFVGDQLEKDVLKPIELGMDGILFNPKRKNTTYNGRTIQHFKELL
jgi:HAD superfamily hydrolase (TIGR01662 family)